MLRLWIRVGQSAAAVLELSVLSDGQLGGVARRQAVADAGRAVTLLHLRQRRHQPRVRRVQGVDPLLLIGQRQEGEGLEVRLTLVTFRIKVCGGLIINAIGLKPPSPSQRRKNQAKAQQVQFPPGFKG